MMALAPNNFSPVSFLKGAVHGIGSRLSGINDHLRAGFYEVLGDQLHAATAAVTHLGRMAVACTVRLDEDKCLPIFAEK